MQKILICDTNAVIQLSIISQKIFNNNAAFELHVDVEVMKEVDGLLKNPEKEQRLGTELRWILNNIKVSTSYTLPPEWQEIDEVYQLQELGLLESEKSSATGSNDRKFLILADSNKVCLLTREKTLFNLSRRIIGIERTFGISDILILSVQENVLKTKEAEAGIRNLRSKKETLPDRCQTHLRTSGIRCEP